MGKVRPTAFLKSNGCIQMRISEKGRNKLKGADRLIERCIQKRISKFEWISKANRFFEVSFERVHSNADKRVRLNGAFKGG